MSNVNILIPMAGLGTRFAEAGYDKPKPLIDVNGVPMIEAVVNSLNIDGNYFYVVQKEHASQYNLHELLDGITPGCTVVEIDGPTTGAAVTTLAAKDFIDNDSPLIIANSDQIISWDSSIVLDMMQHGNVIATFPAREDKWSYVALEGGLVKQVAEKERISDYATVGVYAWAHGSDYVKYAEQMISKNITTNGEFYVAPVYNEAIADGQKILPYLVDEMNGVGTPDDLEKYLKHVESD